MTPDHSALIERLEAMADEPSRLVREVDRVLAEAAAAIRDLTEWRDISEHSGHAPVMVSTKPSNPNCLFSEPVSAFVDATGVWRCLGSVGGMAPLSRKPTHFRPLPSAPNQAKEAGE